MTGGRGQKAGDQASEGDQDSGLVGRGRRD